jgi:hypothetical protein
VGPVQALTLTRQCHAPLKHKHTITTYHPPPPTTDIKFQWGGVEAPREFYGNNKDGWTEVPNCPRPTQEFVTHTFSQILRRELTKLHYTLPTNAAARNVVNGFVVPSGACVCLGSRRSGVAESHTCTPQCALTPSLAPPIPHHHSLTNQPRRRLGGAVRERRLHLPRGVQRLRGRPRRPRLHHVENHGPHAVHADGPREGPPLCGHAQGLGRSLL